MLRGGLSRLVEGLFIGLLLSVISGNVLLGMFGGVMIGVLFGVLFPLRQERPGSKTRSRNASGRSSKRRTQTLKQKYLERNNYRRRKSPASFIDNIMGTDYERERSNEGGDWR